MEKNKYKICRKSTSTQHKIEQKGGDKGTLIYKNMNTKLVNDIHEVSVVSTMQCLHGPVCNGN